MEKRGDYIMGIVRGVMMVIIFGSIICSCERGLEEPLAEGEMKSVVGGDTISFSLTCFYSGSNTKAPIRVDETMITDINIYVVNEEGDVVDYKYCVGYNSAFKLFVHKDKRHRIYVMANVGQVGSLRSSSEIEAYRYSVSSIEGIVDSNGGVPMSGKSDMRVFGTGERVNLLLVRAVAVFMVKCDYTGLNKGVKVNVKKIALKNAPSAVSLFSTERGGNSEYIDGEERGIGELSHLESYGEGFWLFENMQGRVAPGAVDNKSKALIMSAEAKMRSSYILMEYDYFSPQKRGSISYKFYLGSSYEDCDVSRNTKYTCTVYFKGNASAEENSESVDNSGLTDRVTAIEITPSSYIFDLVGDTFTPAVKVLPISANNKELVWSSSNPLVATVDKFGSIKAISEGDCIITATSVENPDISATCKISVMQPVIEFATKNKIMYDGEEVILLWKKLIPNSMIPNVVSDNTQVLDIIEVNSIGVRVRAKNRGNVAVTASKAKATDVCNISVEELKITFGASSPLFFYSGFNDPIPYSVSPSHASLLHSQGKLKINWSSSDENSLKHVSDNLFRGGNANSSADIVATFADYPSKKFSLNVSVKPAINISEKNVNLAACPKVSEISPSISADIHVSSLLTVETHPRAVINWSGPNVGVAADNVHVDSQNRVYLDNNSRANGSYLLIGTIKNADDGVEYNDRLSINVFDVVKIWMVNNEVNIGPVEGETEYVNIESSYIGRTDQINNRVGVFRCILVPSVNNEILIDTRDTFLYYYDYSFVEHINYPCKEGEVVYVKILDPFDNGLGSDKRYRFYYSADSL